MTTTTYTKAEIHADLNYLLEDAAAATTTNDEDDYTIRVEDVFDLEEIIRNAYTLDETTGLYQIAVDNQTLFAIFEAAAH